MRSMAALLRSSVRLVSLRMIRMSQAPATTTMRTDLAPAGDGSMLTVLSGRSDLSVTAKKSEKKRNIAGRAWRADELRLKSNEDLHKLWYVLLKEKNMVESNKLRIKKTTGNGLKSAKLGKVKQSMARLLTVMSERKKIREAYKRQLENEYVERKRQEELERIQSSSFLPGSPESRVEVPVLSQTLLRNKYRALKQGVDTLDYIKDMLEHQKQKEAEKLRVRETYNYKKKQVIGAEDTIDPTETEDDVIRSFKSLIDKQLSTGQYKLTSGEILASHVRNWRSLTLKQKRIVLNFINARRAREAKSEFLTELSLLGQKIAHDDIQRQLN